MKRSTKIITTVALTVGLVGAAAAFGKHRGGNPEKRAEKIASYIAYELELDDSQKASLDTLKDQLLNTRQTFHETHAPMKAEALSMISAESFDQSRMLAMINEKTAAVNEQAPQIVSALGEFLDGLNSEQKTEIMEFVNDHHGRKGRH